jgi:RNA polymerase sigma-70 factor (ECF subfamily)
MVTRGVTVRGTADDGGLQAAAIGGDGHAFAALYDRHERRVYGFCLRMLGSPIDAADATQETFLRMLEGHPALDGRELNFAAYVLKIGRNACYDAIDARGTVEPVAGHEDLPLERVRSANASLPPRQREVLALREVESLSYAEIGDTVGVQENAVAKLISRARIGLRNAVRGSALESVGPATADCLRALPLLAALQDGEDSDLEDLSFLHSHLASCETCRLRREAMEEASVTYRALLPIVTLAWLRHATIARAAEVVGADWSHVSGDTYGGGTPARVAFDRGSRRVGAGARGLGGRRGGGGGRRRRVHRWLALAVLALCVAAVVVLVSTTGRHHVVPAVARSPARAASAVRAVRARVRPVRHRVHKRSRKKSRLAVAAPAVAARPVRAAVHTHHTAAAPKPVVKPRHHRAGGGRHHGGGKRGGGNPLATGGTTPVATTTTPAPVTTGTNPAPTTPTTPTTPGSPGAPPPA